MLCRISVSLENFASFWSVLKIVYLSWESSFFRTVFHPVALGILPKSPQVAAHHHGSEAGNVVSCIAGSIRTCECIDKRSASFI